MKKDGQSKKITESKKKIKEGKKTQVKTAPKIRKKV